MRVLIFCCYAVIGVLVSLSWMTKALKDMQCMDHEDEIEFGVVGVFVAAVWPVLLLVIGVFWLGKKLGKKLVETAKKMAGHDK